MIKCQLLRRATNPGAVEFVGCSTLADDRQWPARRPAKTAGQPVCSQSSSLPTLSQTAALPAKSARSATATQRQTSDSLDGAIRLAGEPDKGTTFQVLLPFSKTAAGAGGHVMPGDGDLAVLSQHGTVLVVEDEGPLRQAIVKMLRKTGFEVFEAADGFSAVDLLRAAGRKIDVILLDMTLPGASTREIVAEAANAKPDIKVILTSAYSREMIGGALNAPQIYSFVRKPFRFGDLLKNLRSSLSS